MLAVQSEEDTCRTRSVGRRKGPIWNPLISDAKPLVQCHTNDLKQKLVLIMLQVSSFIIFDLSIDV